MIEAIRSIKVKVGEGRQTMQGPVAERMVNWGGVRKRRCAFDACRR